MFSKSKTAINTIGQESMYVLEKSRSAIYKEANDVDIDLAKHLLETYKEKMTKLKNEIDANQLYDNTYFDYEFETLFYAIDKLLSLLGSTNTKEKELEASIYQSHICSQDEHIRQGIEEVENP